MRIDTISAEATIDLRHRILWPNKSKSHCVVEGDDNATHFGVFIGNELVGVASVFDISGLARLRKFAVDNQHQGRGLGSALLSHAINVAEEEGASTFWFDARESAIEFYKRFGFIEEGAKFYKSDIPYFKMSKSLKSEG